MSRYDKAADLLDSAADHIEKVGLHKGDFAAYDPDEGALPRLPKCVLGALSYVSGIGLELDPQEERWMRRGPFPSLYITAMSGLEQTLYQQVGEYNAPQFNDAPSRTQQEVLDALRLTAKNMRAIADREARGE